MRTRLQITSARTFIFAVSLLVLSLATPGTPGSHALVLERLKAPQGEGGGGGTPVSRGEDITLVLARLEEARRADGIGDRDLARMHIRAAIDLALPILEQHVDPDHLCLCAVGSFAHQIGELQDALRFRRAVVEVSLRTLPEDHPELLRAWSNLALTTRVLGDLAGARALQEAVLAARERTLPDEHPDVLVARGNLAVTLRLLGDLTGARALQETVVAARERTLPEGDPHLLAAQQGLAATLAELRELEGARALQEAALAGYERTLPDDHPDLLRARAIMAWIVRELGDLRGARVLEEAVLGGLERAFPADHPEVLVARGNLAATMQALGDSMGARRLYEAVLVVYERTLPEDHPDILRVRENLTAAVRAVGDLEGARVLGEFVLAGYERTLPEDHQEILGARLNLAATIQSLGDIEGARVHYGAVLAGCERTLPEDHPVLLAARNGLALTKRELGDLAGARALFEAVLAGFERTLREDHPHILTARANLAMTMGELGDLAGARALQVAVLAARERTLPKDHPDILRELGNLAWLERELGDLARAQALQEAALGGFKRILPEGHPKLLSVQLNLAWTSARLAAEGAHRRGEETGEWHRAMALASDAVRGAGQGVRTALLGSSAREAEERVARITEDPLDQALSFALGHGLFSAGETLRGSAFELSESGRGAGLAAARLARAARGSVEYGVLRDAAHAASAELAALVQDGAGAEAFHAARSRREAAERGLARLAAELLGDEGAGLEVDAAALTARLGSGEGLVAFRRYTRSWLEEVGGADTLGPRLERRSLESLGAFVLARAEVGAEPRLAFVDLGSVDAIDAAVRGWRAAIGVGTSGQVRSGASQERGARGIGLDELPISSGAAEARALRRLVWDPLVPALGTSERVSVALDDVLHLVPLEALLLEEEERLLGERWRIETRTSFWELLAEDPPVDPAGALVALGDVAYGAEPVAWSEGEGEQERGGETRLLAQAGGYASVLRGSPSEEGFAPLANTGPEVHVIAALWRESGGPDASALVLEGPRASLASLEVLAPRARWLHLATHGWFAPDRIRSFADRSEKSETDRAGLHLRTDAEETAVGMSPLLLCGLALAGSNLAPDSLGRVPGLLTAEELSGLDLTSCELAVLSACDTNVGRLARAGQGVASLQKALHMAGARSVITSLWKVDDAATAKLFERFYTLLWQDGLPKSEALWRTKMQLRGEGHPVRDWAAWVLTGDPG